MIRRAITLIELVAAGAVLAVLLLVSAKMLGATAAQQRAMESRRLVIEEADNLMERLFAQPWAQLSTAQSRQWRLSEQLRHAVPTSQLAVQIRQEAGPPAAKQIAVTIRWHDRAGESDRTFRLVAWRYPNGDQSP